MQLLRIELMQITQQRQCARRRKVLQTFLGGGSGVGSSSSAPSLPGYRCSSWCFLLDRIGAMLRNGAHRRRDVVRHDPRSLMLLFAIRRVVKKTSGRGVAMGEAGWPMLKPS